MWVYFSQLTFDTAKPVSACHPANQAEDTNSGALGLEMVTFMEIPMADSPLLKVQTLAAEAEAIKTAGNRNPRMLVGQRGVEAERRNCGGVFMGEAKNSDL